MIITVPTEVFTAGQLKELDNNAFEKARCAYEVVWSYSSIQDNLRCILAGDYELDTAGEGSFWPAPVEVLKYNQDKDLDICFDLHYHSFLHMKAKVDLLALQKQLKSPHLAATIGQIKKMLKKLGFSPALGYPLDTLIVTWYGRTSSATTEFGTVTTDWLTRYFMGLENQLLHRLEQMDSDEFSDESFITTAAINEWIFAANGSLQAWPEGTEKPAELVALFEKESS